MAWGIYYRYSDATMWRGKDAEGRTVWSCTTNRDGVAVEPTDNGLYSKRIERAVYLDEHPRLVRDTYQLPPDMLDALSDRAGSTGISKSEVVRRALARELNL